MAELRFAAKALLLVATLTVLAVTAIWWARQPGGRELKLFVLGGPIVLLIHDLVDDEQVTTPRTGSRRGR